MGSTDTKERILEVAASLFAQKGYAAIGVREISKEANVNISMISYYYQGKEGVLKEIVNRFSTIYTSIYKESYCESRTIDENLKELVTNLVNAFRKHTDIMKIGYLELPFGLPEVAEIKTDIIKSIIANNTIFKQLGLNEEESPVLFSILGPVFISSMFSNFLLSPLIKKIMDVDFSEAYYENYIEVLTSFLKGGIQNIIKDFIE
jgi:AcrR family transcriptional regulator